MQERPGCQVSTANDVKAHLKMPHRLGQDAFAPRTEQQPIGWRVFCSHFDTRFMAADKDLVWESAREQSNEIGRRHSVLR